MNKKNLAIALLVVFALGGYIGQGQAVPTRDRPLARIIHRAAEYGLTWMFWSRFTRPEVKEGNEMQSVNVPGEIVHSRSL
jgi:hypothetical protein